MRYGRLVLAVSIALLAIGVVLHIPLEVQRVLFGRVVYSDPIYDDLYAFVKNTFYTDSCSQSSIWVNKEVASILCRGGMAFPIPYLDYRLAQPPVAGLILALSTSIGMYLSGGRQDAFLASFYVIQSMLSIIAVSWSIYILYKKEYLRGLFPLYALTLAVYGVYSFDSLALPFIAGAVVEMREGRISRAVLYSALASSVNFFAIVILGLLVYVALREGPVEPGVVKGLIAGLSPFLIVLALDPGYYSYVLNDVLQPAFNNGVFSLLTLRTSTGAAYGLNTGIWVFTMLLLYSMIPPPSSGEGLVRYASIVAFILYTLHPRMVPQTLLITLLLLLTWSKPVDPLLLLVEVSNALVIILWFKAGALAEYIAKNIGVKTSPNPASLDNPVQWIVQFRNALAVIYSIEEASRNLGN